VIRPEQLAEALDRIPPRDRELLSLSLRRRVPDEALGRLYECSPSEVARRRARAIERLADEMELQRGEDLGAVLKALLEPDTWSQAANTLGEEFAAGGGRSRLTAVPVPEEAPEVDRRPPALAPVPFPREPEKEPAVEAEPAPVAEPQPEPVEAPAAQPEPVEAPAAEVEPAPGDQAAPDPVLEMFAEREREAPDPPRRAVPLALVGLGVAALVGAAGVIGATQFGDSHRTVARGTGGGGEGTRDFVPEKGGPLAAPFPTETGDTACYSTASIKRSTVLYREPGGEKRLRITPRTEWGSSRVLGVVSQRGEWLGVQASELKNGEIAWVPRDKTTLDCVSWSLHADLSKRALVVRHNGRTVRKLEVAIGRKDNPTPKGRFTVTDRLQVTSSGSPYGCCVLALTGHQTDLPPYWPGGDRLAVHATNDESSIGQPVSLGCMRAVSAEARWLINHVPLGSPVFIHS
jgi:L,D-transpeptidase catalytic domain